MTGVTGLSDTRADVAQLQIQQLRLMPTWRKLALVADLRLGQAEPLAQILGDAFYADLDTIQDAIRRQSSFNLLHLETMFKVDVFVAKIRAFDRAQLAHRQLLQVSDNNPVKQQLFGHYRADRHFFQLRFESH